MVYTASRLWMKYASIAIYSTPCIVGDTESTGLAAEETSKEGGAENCINYNIDLMRPSLNLLDGLIWFIIIFSLLCDILCYKYRHLANIFIYLQIFHLTVTRIVPNVESESYKDQFTQFAYTFLALN